jgi:hypothetical protein
VKTECCAGAKMSECSTGEKKAECSGTKVCPVTGKTIN